VDTSIQREKLEQAVEPLDTWDSDCWHTFRVRMEAAAPARGMLRVVCWAGRWAERGDIGLKDEVLVTEDGADYLSSVQRELIFVE
jgi:hypothetical protein